MLPCSARFRVSHRAPSSPVPKYTIPVDTAMTRTMNHAVYMGLYGWIPLWYHYVYSTKIGSWDYCTDLVDVYSVYSYNNSWSSGDLKPGQQCWLLTQRAAEKKQQQVKKASYVESNLFKSAFFLGGIPRLRNMFLTFKTPKPDISAFCWAGRWSFFKYSSRDALQSSIRYFPRIRSWRQVERQGAVEVHKTQQEFLWMDRGAFFHCWLRGHPALLAAVPTNTIL